MGRSGELGFFEQPFLIQQGYYRSKDLPYVTQLVPCCILNSLGTTTTLLQPRKK